MPFADDGRLIACCAQCAGEGAFVLADNHRRIARQNLCIFIAPWIGSGEEAVARRSASGCGRVTIGIAHAFLGHLVEVRCRQFGCAVASEITEAEVVGINNNEVGQFHKWSVYVEVWSRGDL